MRKTVYAAGLAAVLALSISGCSAIEAADNGYKATDIGGVGKGGSGDLFEGIAEALGADRTTMDVDGGMAFFADTADALGEAAPGAAIPVSGGVPVEENRIEPQSGLLTGGEWDDNEHWEDWRALYDSQSDWSHYREAWKNKAVKRYVAKVQNEKGEPLAGAVVKVGGWMSAVTDNKGEAYLFGEDAPGSVTVTYAGAENGAGKAYSWESADAYTDMTDNFVLNGGIPQSAKKLDLMIVCDTTGSMGDELEYLKVELADIVQKIKSENANIPTRVSVNFYRDEGDEYEVRAFPFSENIGEVVKAIGEQSAEGGGDFPEAVHTALRNAVDGHDWDEDSVKLMFLVLDAPPHSDDQIVDEVNKYVKKAAEMGIRIIPIASSGIDKSTEYLLRVMAQVTGGTYTFLTNDSGIGGDHIEATVGAYNVEKLNDMMVRIVSGYLE